MTGESQKVLVGLSGGVDSSVAALLLQRQGYDVSGVYLRTWMQEDFPWGDCPSAQDVEDAGKAADAMGIPFEVVNLIDEYREKVVEYMIQGYSKGRTPNPDVMCNREIKFGVFLDYALRVGFDMVATGHYCRRVEEDGAVQLWEGADKNKDQSYFLALVRAGRLDRVLFPLGEMQKAEVRTEAEKCGLPNAARKDSQGICFLGKVKVNEFLREFIPDCPGEIVDVKGTKLGRHLGLHRYTIGQRKGIGVPSNSDDEHFVVVAKRARSNELVVAFESAQEHGLYERRFLVEDLNFLGDPIFEERELLAKPRYRDPSQAILFKPQANGTAEIVFDEPQRALASGQMIALYEGEKLLGGGFYS